MSPLRVRYQTIELAGLDLHVRTLWDTQQFLDVDGVAERAGISSAIWPLFGVVWPAGHALATMMLDYDVAGRRVLEVGCGIALASLVLSARGVDITATDHNPEAAGFLRANVALNGGRELPFVCTRWSDRESTLGKFDLIIGSDVLYESGQVDLLSAFVDDHALPACSVVLVDPGRGNRAGFGKQMAQRGYAHSRAKADTVDHHGRPFHGDVLTYAR